MDRCRKRLFDDVSVDVGDDGLDTWKSLPLRDYPTGDVIGENPYAVRQNTYKHCRDLSSISSSTPRAILSFLIKKENLEL